MHTLGEEDLVGIAEEAERRYGDIAKRHRLMPGTPMEERAATTHRMARRVLAADGFHRTLAWTYRDGTPLDQLALDSTDQADKILQMRRLAAAVAHAGADAVILVTESWTAPNVPREDPRFDQRAGERDDRTEALLTHLLQRNGEHRHWLSPFERAADQSILLSEPQEPAFERFPLFDPLIMVWESWKDKDSSG